MRGVAYGVGVGPGDPELMTLKAVRVIRECGAIALPGESPRASVAYRIAAAAVPSLAEKALLPIPVPMVKDPARVAAAQVDAAAAIESILEKGQDVAYLTLGDPSLYSSFTGIRRRLEADGHAVQTVPGVTSFCAAASRLGMPLAEWDEPLSVVPAAHSLDGLAGSGNCVIMKPSGRLAEIRSLLRDSGRSVGMVENCAMPGERVFIGADAIPDEAGHFSLIIAKR